MGLCHGGNIGINRHVMLLPSPALPRILIKGLCSIQVNRSQDAVLLARWESSATLNGTEPLLLLFLK